ncbi:T9SS type A sorting domain-containing protein [Aquimarina sp. RZ0]|uniref:T9SS type A sorting domain-containing protein n=1 Tax=Aquimarina sp. RZ0 TaxID=2607730 RepID=UPI00165F9E85|nr:T9SS type A sorting domain-containing protein [Aquimarina sp. RZ0]
MKKLILRTAALFCYIIASSQVTNEPLRTKKVDLKSAIPLIEMPSFDLKKLQKEDATNDLQTKPFRFGYEFTVDLGIKNSGVWEELPNGDRVWRISIASKDAKTLNFIFDRYELAEGATVHLYNDDRSFMLGAYTNKMNNENESLGTWIADGEKITIEFYEPAKVKGLSKLHIGSVVHGYRSVSNFEAYQKTLNESGDCNLDVNCSIGADFDPLKDKLKKSVAVILSNGIEWCTGTLINNTNNDKAPYLLTANHCGGKEANWSFRFNWISSNTVCASTDNSTDNGPGNYYQVTAGATVLAKNGGTDFKLIEISGGLDPAWDLEWAGWDRTDDFPSYVIGIHHPSGDVMKVCRDDSGVTKEINNAGGGAAFNAETWEITDAGDGWEQGVTEEGSSGSALFDPNGRIIGQLFGGRAVCSGTNNNNRLDYYGRLGVSWDIGNTRATRLSDWLDPANTGETTLDMLSKELTAVSVNDEGLKQGVSVYPNPTTGILNISNNTQNRASYTIYNVVGQNIATGEKIVNENENEKIDISAKNTGIYFITITSNNSSFTKKIIKR